MVVVKLLKFKQLPYLFMDTHPCLLFKILILLGSLQNSVLVTPRNATVGQSSVLTCEVKTSLPVTTRLLSVQWRHRGRLVTTNNGEFVLKQGTGNEATNAVYVTELRFDEIGVEHSGLYSCHVSLDTDRRQVTAEGNLTVTCEIIIINHNNVYG